VKSTAFQGWKEKGERECVGAGHTFLVDAERPAPAAFLAALAAFSRNRPIPTCEIPKSHVARTFFFLTMSEPTDVVEAEPAPVAVPAAAADEPKPVAEEPRKEAEATKEDEIVVVSHHQGEVMVCLQAVACATRLFPQNSS